MLKKIGLIFILGISLVSSKAQSLESYSHQAEYGFSVGLGHYFGDLNTGAKINRPKFAGGIFFRKQVNNYVGVRISANYAFLAYSDVYSNNPVEQQRNLSFNTNVWEMSVSGDFNFFKFVPGFEEYRFTPYVSLGFGAFSFDPYAYMGGQKYLLRPLGTEGQGSALYPDKKPYSPIALCIPFGVGMKYAINERMNVFGEISYRFTNTDYLDDVSGTYAPDAFPPLPNGNPSPAFLLQDRSYETGTSIGIKGRQRGNSLQKDAFVTLQVGMSFNIQSYRCPTY
ncbi:MAG: DUF6089 family protein [Bacteroidota bacterium]